MIPFTVSIPPEEQDRKVCEKLLTELPGILNWALQGCVHWQREGLDLPLEVKTAIATYRAEMDTLADFFAECCIVAPNAMASAKEVYLCYSLWCEENGERPERQKAFGMGLSERGFNRVKKISMIWHGIGVVRGTGGTGAFFRFAHRVDFSMEGNRDVGPVPPTLGKCCLLVTPLSVCSTCVV